MKSTLALDSPAFQDITELRRVVTLNQVKAMPFIKGIHPSELRLKELLAQAHVLDFGHLLDAQHGDCLGTEAEKMVNEASRDRGIEGLLLPFPRTAFLFRNLMRRSLVRGVAGFFQVLVLLEQVGGIVVHPSIGVVHVNKPLVISKRGGRQTTGWKMPGHDRRQHKRTCRKSRKTIIAGHQSERRHQWDYGQAG